MDHKQTLSTSKKGSSSFASKTVRFPLRHSHWGMPGPFHYAPESGSSLYPSIQTDPRHPSASFLAIGRDHPFGTHQMEDTPSPGQYDAHAYDSIAVRFQSYNSTYSNSRRPANCIPVEYKKLQSAACKAQKSVSKYIIEADPLYVPLPEPLQENALTAEERFNPENRAKEMRNRIGKHISPHIQYREHLKELTEYFDVQLPSTRDFIQEEINADLAESPTYAQAPASEKTGKRSASMRIVRGFKGKTLTGRIAGSSTTYIKKPVTMAGAMGVEYLLDSPHEQTQIGTNISKEKQKRLEIYEKLISDAPSKLKESIDMPPPGQYRPAFGLATANQDTILREHRIWRDYERVKDTERALHGPGEYTVQDDFVRRRSESVPALHATSERFRGLQINEVPGPGTYDISRDLSSHKSFLLNEERKFVVV